MTPGVIADWLAHRAAVMPDRIALVAGERDVRRSWSFAALDADVTLLARRLAALGVAPGARVASLASGADAAMLVHAMPRLGATLVPLNTRLGDAELEWQIGDCGAELLVTDARSVERGARLHARAPWLCVVCAGDTDHATIASIDSVEPTHAALRLHHPADHVLAIIYTSGTTGRPKGAMLTVGNFWWSAVGSALNLGTLAHDRWLAVLPLFHVGGMSIVTRAAIYGITAIVHDAFDAEAVNRAIDEEGVTMVSLVAVTLQRTLDARGDRPFPASLRSVLLGGGPAPRPLLERCAARGVPVVQTYGLTETTSQIATLAPEDALRRLGSAGKPLYPNELRIAPGDTGDRSGEILVRGPVVMAGYVNQPEATARALADGWLHTGDVGRLDDDGYLYVLDRRDDLVVTGGENVYPAEVEAVLLAHPVVVEAGVIGASDPEWGQRVVAVVRLRDSAAVEPDALRHFCRERIASYKVPREIRVTVEPLPRTASGKLQRAVLRDRFAR